MGEETMWRAFLDAVVETARPLDQLLAATAQGALSPRRAAAIAEARQYIFDAIKLLVLK